MKTTQAVAFVVTATLLSTFTYGYSFTDTNPAKVSDKVVSLKANEENRVYGGTEANIDDYPFLASLRDPFFGKTVCSGTLIAPQYVLTAAHCSQRIYGLIATFGTNSSTGDSEDDGFVQVDVIAQYRHPLYSKDTHIYDVGIFKLARPIRRTPAKLCATNGAHDAVGNMVKVAGWGVSESHEKSGYSLVLREIRIPIISNAECGKAKRYIGRITDSMLCAGTGKGKDTCNGDSGSPLIYKDNILVGCVSWGSTCGEQAGVFTRLTYVMDYIEDILAGGDGSKFGTNNSSESSPIDVNKTSSINPWIESPLASLSESLNDDELPESGIDGNIILWLLKQLSSKSGSDSDNEETGNVYDDKVTTTSKGHTTAKNLLLEKSSGGEDNDILTKDKPALKKVKSDETFADGS